MYLLERAVRGRHHPRGVDERAPAEGLRLALQDEHGLPGVLVHLHHAAADDAQPPLHSTAH